MLVSRSDLPNSSAGKESARKMQETLVWFLGWDDYLEKG